MPNFMAVSFTVAAIVPTAAMAHRRIRRIRWRDAPYGIHLAFSPAR
ncbi:MULTISPECIES: hypothetical protein [unclassified Nocardia]|nr:MULTISPECIES: hypothetical protein [unclassified Nocardia]